MAPGSIRGKDYPVVVGAENTAARRTQGEEGQRRRLALRPRARAWRDACRGAGSVESEGMEEGGQVAAPLLPKAALAYAGRGVPVFPCEPGAKRPLTRNGHRDATTDRRAIERWTRWRTANIGLPTGKKGGILVLDVDVDDGRLESLAKLERAGAPVPKTARTRTGEVASTSSSATRAVRRFATARGC